MEVRPAETKIILGAGGSGKTTLLKMVLGLVKPDSGRIFIEDQDELVGYNEEEDIDEQAEMAEKLKEVTDKEDEGLSAKK